MIFLFQNPHIIHKDTSSKKVQFYKKIKCDLLLNDCINYLQI